MVGGGGWGIPFMVGVGGGVIQFMIGGGGGGIPFMVGGGSIPYMVGVGVGYTIYGRWGYTICPRGTVVWGIWYEVWGMGYWVSYI